MLSYFRLTSPREYSRTYKNAKVNDVTDEEYMSMALRLAENARGRTSPNPLVGAVIVKDDRVVAAGWHRKAGTPHAEIHALNMAGELAHGATMYVTLEPCDHYGRTGPCSKAIIEAGIARVVVALEDPHPKVNGGGMKELRNAGIEVKCGVLRDEARRQNEVFLKWITTGRPFVRMKMAMTLDGKIATTAGESEWITNEKSRERGHVLRDESDAILVGIGTVLHDNPSLTARIAGKTTRNPVRVVLDSMARIPMDADVLNDGKAPTIIAVTKSAPNENIDAIKAKGADVIICGGGKEVDIDKLLLELGKREITSLLVEGGGRVNYSFIATHNVDKVYAFMAPMIVGGRDALTGVEGNGIAHLSDAVRLENISTELIDGDILVTGYVKK